MNRSIKTVYSWFTIYLNFKVSQLHAKLIPKDRREIYWKGQHAKYAEKMWKNIIELKGWWVKVGQFMSTRSDILPQEYITQLSKVQNMMPASPFNEVKAIIESELNQNLDSIFEYIEPEAIAAASIGQVHKGRLLTGEDIVIKVQHTNIDKMLAQDMNLLLKMTEILKVFEKSLNFRDVLIEWQKQAELELDFRLEMENQLRAFKGLSNTKINVKIPYCYPKYTTAKIMVQEFIDGFKITDKAKLIEYNVNNTKLCRDIVESFAYQIHIDGLFNGDPHPGNILVTLDKISGEAIPVLLDWGLVKEFDYKKRIAFSRFIIACNDLDVMSLIEAIAMFGFEFKNSQGFLAFDPELYYDAVKLMFMPNDSVDSIAKSKNSTNGSEKNEIWQNRKKVQTKNPINNWPKDIIFFIRVAFLLHGLCKTLDAKVPFFQILLKRAGEALLTSSLESNINTVSRADEMHVFNKSKCISNLQIRIVKIFNKLFGSSYTGAIQIYVKHKDQVIVDFCAGQLETYNCSKIQRDSLFCGFSLINILLVLAILNLVNEKKMLLDDKLNSWWVGLIDKKHEEITIQDLLTMQSGLHNWLPSNLNFNLLVDYRKMIKECEAYIPTCEPKNCGHYSYFTHSYVLNELLESSILFCSSGQYIKSILLDKLNLKNYKNDVFYPLIKFNQFENSSASFRLKSSKTPSKSVSQDTKVVTKPRTDSLHVSVFYKKLGLKAKDLASSSLTNDSLSSSKNCSNLIKSEDDRCLSSLLNGRLVKNFRASGAASLADSMFLKRKEDEKSNYEIQKEQWHEELNHILIKPKSRIMSKFPGRNMILKTRKSSSRFSLLKNLVEQNQITRSDYLGLFQSRPIVLDPLIFNSIYIHPFYIPPGNLRINANLMTEIISKTKELVGEEIYESLTKIVTIDNSVSARIYSGGFQPEFGIGLQVFRNSRKNPNNMDSARANILKFDNGFNKIQSNNIFSKIKKKTIKKSIFTTSLNTKVNFQYAYSNDFSYNSSFECSTISDISSKQDDTNFHKKKSKNKSKSKDLDTKSTAGLTPNQDLYKNYFFEKENSRLLTFNSFTESTEKALGMEFQEKSCSESDNSQSNDCDGFGWSDMFGNLCVHFPNQELSLTILINDLSNGAETTKIFYNEILSTFGMVPIYQSQL